MVGKKAVCLGALILMPCLLGMGMFGQPPARVEVPQTKERFDATVEDLDGVVVHITHVSYDGELYLPVYRGKGLVTVPFREIQKIEFGEKEQSQREVKIFFRDDTNEVFRIDEDILILGRLPYGTYQILTKNILRLVFTQPSSE